MTDQEKIDYLIKALEDISTAQMMWNGGVVPPSRKDLNDFIQFLRKDAGDAITHIEKFK